MFALLKFLCSQRCQSSLIQKKNNITESYYYEIYYAQVWDNICTGNGLLPDSTKTLLEPNADLSTKIFFGVHHRAFLEEIPMNIMCFEFTLSRFSSHLSPGQWVVWYQGQNTNGQKKTWIQL